MNFFEKTWQGHRGPAFLGFGDSVGLHDETAGMKQVSSPDPLDSRQQKCS